MKTHNDVFKDAVMLRTYCRDIQVEGTWRKERPDEVFRRTIDSFERYYSVYLCEMSLKEGWKEDWFQRMSQGKALPAGRMLWSMGSDSIAKDGYLPMMNCGFVVLDDPVEPIRFIMKMLMLGCGMGFSLESKHFQLLKEKFFDLRWVSNTEKGPCPIIREVTTEDSHMVQDSKEGWVDFIVEVVHFAILMKPFRFNLSKIRPVGSRIKGFGGRSGDPKILANIAIRIYNLITKERYASVAMYYDVICSIGELVISGNVRRSALIAIGDPNDGDFLLLKNFYLLKEKPWRCYCNNSVNVSEFEQLNDTYWSTYNGNSEAYGWVNIKKCRAWDENPDIKYFLPEGFNPCGEQPLASRELCCLGEVNLARAESEQDLFESLKMCYLFCKMSFLLKSSEPKTDRITTVNQRIGVSLTGIAMVHPAKRTWSYISKLRLVELDEEFSERIGVNPSIALTTVKPGGTLPKIAGSSGPGIHRPISEYQIRRVRFNKSSKLLSWLSDLGLPIEPQINFDGNPDPSGTQVVSFYLKNERPEDGYFSEDQLTEEGLDRMLDLIATTQDCWSDNAISVTVYYNPDKVEQLRRKIGEYFYDLKVFSGLPYYGHGFPQAPEEPISEQEYINFTEKNPIPDYVLPLECDSDDNEIDFGQCSTKGSCSDR